MTDTQTNGLTIEYNIGGIYNWDPSETKEEQRIRQERECLDPYKPYYFATRVGAPLRFKINYTLQYLLQESTLSLNSIYLDMRVQIAGLLIQEFNFQVRKNDFQFAKITIASSWYELSQIISHYFLLFQLSDVFDNSLFEIAYKMDNALETFGLTIKDLRNINMDFDKECPSYKTLWKNK